METLNTYLTEQSAACAARSAALRCDSREDEAVFERIRGNVFDIFRSVAQAARTQPEPRAFFQSKLEAIPSAWSAAREQALAHGDEQKAHIEQIKLDTVQAIREQLEVRA